MAGDFYDAFLLPDGKLMFLVADVCDKGIGAALFMTLFRSLIRAASTGIQFSPTQAQPLTPSEQLLHTVSLTNNYVAETHEAANMFATVFIAILDAHSGQVWYINCGNDPALIISGDGSVRDQLKPTGPVVGALSNSRYKVEETRLTPDEMILAFTDGIPDTKNAGGEFFGVTRLTDLLSPKDTPTALLEKVAAALASFSGETEQFDDITLMGIKRKA
ncbi:MAG TPA: PP2C family protein-serine/threonine phosphatase [Anaerolineales bacterium]|nr:PP2C family protein-serine/threonine phosphatase [Anaerolineales bacterium]